MSTQTLTIENNKAKADTAPDKAKLFAVTLTGNGKEKELVAIQFEPNPNASFCMGCGETKEIDIGENKATGFEVKVDGLASGTFTLKTLADE